jgi:hypothetical protein
VDTWQLTQKNASWTHTKSTGDYKFQVLIEDAPAGMEFTLMINDETQGGYAITQDFTEDSPACGSGAYLVNLVNGRQYMMEIDIGLGGHHSLDEDVVLAKAKICYVCQQN